MSTFDIVTTSPLAYLYVEKTTSMDQNEIGAAMGEGFQTVYGHMMVKGITPTGAALAVYVTPPSETMTYHVGFGISQNDMEKANDEVMGGILPTQRVVQFTHKGPYSKLGEVYERLSRQMEVQGLQCVGPSWEIYLNDPSTVTEAELLTEIYMPIG